MTPTTATSVSEATAADSWSIPELAASDAASSAVLRRIGRSGGSAHARNATRKPGIIAFVATTPPARGLRTIDPTPFRLRLERSKPRAAGDAAGRARSACSPTSTAACAPFGRGFGAPWAARRAHGLRGGFRWDAEDSRTKAWYPQGIAVSPDGSVVLVSWYHKPSNTARVSLRRRRARPLPPRPA